MKNIFIISLFLIYIPRIILSQCVYNISPQNNDTVLTLTPNLQWYMGCYSCNPTYCTCFGFYGSPDITLRVATDSLMNNVIYTKYGLLGINNHTIQSNVLQDTTIYWWNLTVICTYLCHYSFPNCQTGPGGGSCSYYSTPFKFITNINPSGIISLSNEISDHFSLSQNYPNPFNPITKFKIQMQKETFAKLIVFDVLGNLAAILVDQALKPGIYELNFNGSNLASGIYFYKLQVGDFIETKKMVLLK